ncbi:hypothetical protein EDF67_11276 [Sphingobacterium sp. JUb78]|nr:hypothetical protein [Sphingobacterium kitahiroshimense]TCR03417.1 hypothetical protein EDF67_11276 [Sphingobacterium sp. JUb78]
MSTIVSSKVKQKKDFFENENRYKKIAFME